MTPIRLDEACMILMGQAPKGEAYNDNGQGWPLIAGAGDFGDIYPAAKKFTREASKLSQAGDIILGIRATIGEKVRSDGVYCLGRGVAGLRPKGKLNSHYLWHWLTHVRHELESKAKGATFQQVNKNDIGELKITLPPLPEQRRIADILDRAEALRAKRRKALAELDSLVQAIFIDMFGDLDRYEWPIATVADVAYPTPGSIRTGPFGSQLLHSEFTDEGVAVLGIDNAVSNEFCWGKKRHISPNKYTQLKKYTVNPGDVLITIMGTCGKCAIVPDDIPVAINTKHLCCITLDPKKCTPSFLHAYFLMHPTARRYLDKTAKGAIMDGLNMGIIKAMPIPIVPLPLQREFDRSIASVNKLRASHRASLAELDALFDSLQHRAFRGEL